MTNQQTTTPLIVNESLSNCRPMIVTIRRCPILMLVVLSIVGLVLFPSQVHYTCNAFATISPSLIIGSRAHQHHAAGGSRRYATAGGSDQSLPTDIDINEDDSHLLQQHQQQQSQQQTTRNRREFFVHSIATASSVVVGSTMISMMSPPFVSLALAAEDDTPTTTSSTIIDPAIQMPTITQKIFLDIKFQKYVEPKRLIIGLFGKDVSKTVDNFVKLCTNNNGGENESGASYVGSTFYRGTNVLL